jgi:hypothetical protein
MTPMSLYLNLAPSRTVILAEDNCVQPTVSWTLEDYFYGVAVILAEDNCVQPTVS